MQPRLDYVAKAPELMRAVLALNRAVAVSYTHLDVYKRQKLGQVPVALVRLEGGSATVERWFNLVDVAE